MWYVIQVGTNQEDRVIGLIRSFVGKDVLKEAFVPQVEVMRRSRGQWQKRKELLLPGYVFVIATDPEKLNQALIDVPAFTRLLGNDVSFTPLLDDEIKFLEAFTAPDRRIVRMSKGVIEGDQIIINEGPLRGQTGLIKRIDRHKRLAYLEMTVMGRKKMIKVGLEIVSKS
ncbi:Transcription antitermination protein nusG [Slackia heliotrinireducens]|uniref:Transcription antiterminator n=1 Tax=Slackia heliotrinireducens (strain ATCC 29202 / DSM 20476 / NCTC 11029 / RHS 1) TaxID=471855 RepID=C7N5S2_SLAHD|nr:antiterminator LoaP [Slackia heliotrinireducens]ACV22257.1 transcription antiterminator [Slackia heliotrinireducens DSM 20476]VEH00415.1 Transcription antitermination protein nusG [Slackia heliotrinireducens]